MREGCRFSWLLLADDGWARCKLGCYSPPTLIHLLHKNPDSAAAGQPDLPGGLVGDPEFQRLGLAALDHVEGFRHDCALDAADRDRAQEVALVVDHQIRAHRTRRRA